MAPGDAVTAQWKCIIIVSSLSLALTVRLSRAWQIECASCLCLKVFKWWSLHVLHVPVPVHTVYLLVFVFSVHTSSPFMLLYSYSSNIKWVVMPAVVMLVVWLTCKVCVFRGPEWLAANFGGQRRIASNHLWDLSPFIIDCSGSWSGLSTETDGKHWCFVNSMRLDESLEVTCCGLSPPPRELCFHPFVGRLLKTLGGFQWKMAGEWWFCQGGIFWIFVLTCFKRRLQEI